MADRPSRQGVGPARSAVYTQSRTPQQGPQRRRAVNTHVEKGTRITDAFRATQAKNGRGDTLPRLESLHPCGDSHRKPKNTKTRTLQPVYRARPMVATSRNHTRCTTPGTPAGCQRALIVLLLNAFASLRELNSGILIDGPESGDSASHRTCKGAAARG